MQVEKIRIIAEDLSVQELGVELIYALNKCDGHYAIRKKTKQKHKEEYEQVVTELREKISKILSVRIPEFKGWRWSIGRLADCVCYITLWNPEWLPKEDGEK